MSALKVCPQCGTEYELDQRFCPKDGSTLKAPNASEDLVGSIIHKSYHVLRKLGEGGMGTVYLAEHVKMGRKSAVKVMNPDMVHDTDAISRFNREASNASKISHPNVAAVYDFGETDDGVIFLAMEYVEGPPLTKVIDDQGALPPHRAAEIARQVADALSVAHEMGIVHRDLKPDNIMLAKNRDGTDCAKVVDFGIAKVANNDAQKVTKTGLVVGTPEYMSPEQLAGDKLDGRSDTYSLGLVAFNMLTGKLPFPAETLQESMIMRLTERPKRLIDMKADVAWSPQVQAVLDRALERSAEARYPTASEFGREFFNAVKGMRDSTATRFVDAVIPPPVAPPTRASASEKPVPPTRISTSTPPMGSPVPAHSKKKSRLPILAGAASVVLGVAVASGIFAAGGGGADTTSPAAPKGDTSRVSGQVAGTVVPIVNLNRELENIDPLTDHDATEANTSEALTRLGRIDSLARVADDSTLLHFRFLRAKALMLQPRHEKAGCDTLRNLESRLKQSRFVRAVDPLLTFCAQR